MPKENVDTAFLQRRYGITRGEKITRNEIDVLVDTIALHISKDTRRLQIAAEERGLRHFIVGRDQNVVTVDFAKFRKRMHETYLQKKPADLFPEDLRELRSMEEEAASHFTPRTHPHLYVQNQFPVQVEG